MKHLLLFLFFALHLSALHAQTPEEVVQENLDFYNKGDIEGFMKAFSEDIQLVEFGETTPRYEGLEDIKTVYQRLFENSPELHPTILHRAVLGNKVIDHEHIVGRKGSDEPLELVMVYEVTDQKISKMTVIRK